MCEPLYVKKLLTLDENLSQKMIKIYLKLNNIFNSPLIAFVCWEKWVEYCDNYKVITMLLNVTQFLSSIWDEAVQITSRRS